MKLSKSIILVSIFSFNTFFLLGSEQKISSVQFLQNELQEIRNLIEQSKIKSDRTKSNLKSLRSKLDEFNDILNQIQRGKENIKQEDHSFIKKHSVITQKSDSNSAKITNSNNNNQASATTILLTSKERSILLKTYLGVMRFDFAICSVWPIFWSPYIRFQTFLIIRSNIHSKSSRTSMPTAIVF